MLADYMTQEGKYRSFSRHGLKSCASPFQANDQNYQKRNTYFLFGNYAYTGFLALTVEDFIQQFWRLDFFSLHFTTKV